MGWLDTLEHIQDETMSVRKIIIETKIGDINFNILSRVDSKSAELIEKKLIILIQTLIKSDPDLVPTLTKGPIDDIVTLDNVPIKFRREHVGTSAANNGTYMVA